MKKGQFVEFMNSAAMVVCLPQRYENLVYADGTIEVHSCEPELHFIFRLANGPERRKKLREASQFISEGSADIKLKDGFCAIGFSGEDVEKVRGTGVDLSRAETVANSYLYRELLEQMDREEGRNQSSQPEVLEANPPKRDKFRNFIGDLLIELGKIIKPR